MKAEKNINKFNENLVLFRRSLIYQTKEFFNNSTLHGVRYIAETGRPFGERFMWFCFTSIGLVAALIIIVSLWEKFQTNPTITGLDTDFRNQQIYFPTVVVCPLEAYDNTTVEEVAYKELGDSGEGNGEMIQSFLRILTSLSFENLNEAYAISLNFTPEFSIMKKSLRSLALQVKISCENTLEYCKYRDEEVKCCPHFDPIYTERGFCYAFNSKFKSKSDGDEPTLEFHDLFETDKKWGLYFVPKAKSKIYVHSHREYFGLDYDSQLIWDIHQGADLMISMRQTYTTEEARQLSIGQRKCIFSNEVQLEYYNDEYSFSGCMKECRIRKCAELCHCIPPFFKPIKNVPYCRIDQLGCLVKYKKNITNIDDCLNCELSCSKTIYDIEKLNKNFEKTENHINIEYLIWPVIRYKREVLFGWVDLLVSFGGIAGLFLGFSLLSGVEIIYFFTMRACCMLYKNRDELYAIEEEIRRKPIPKFHLAIRSSSIRKYPTERRSTSLPPAALLKSSKSFGVRNVRKILRQNARIIPIMVVTPNTKNTNSNNVLNNAILGENKLKVQYKSFQSAVRYGLKLPSMPRVLWMLWVFWIACALAVTYLRVFLLVNYLPQRLLFVLKLEDEGWERRILNFSKYSFQIEATKGKYFKNIFRSKSEPKQEFYYLP